MTGIFSFSYPKSATLNFLCGFRCVWQVVSHNHCQTTNCCTNYCGGGWLCHTRCCFWS